MCFCLSHRNKILCADLTSLSHSPNIPLVFLCTDWLEKSPRTIRMCCWILASRVWLNMMMLLGMKVQDATSWVIIANWSGQCFPLVSNMKNVLDQKKKHNASYILRLFGSSNNNFDTGQCDFEQGKASWFHAIGFLAEWCSCYDCTQCKVTNL